MNHHISTAKPQIGLLPDKVVEELGDEEQQSTQQDEKIGS